MKFTNFAILGFVTAVLASGCAGPEQSEPVEGPTIAVEEESGAGIEVDEGLFDVEVTMPAMFFEGQTEVDIAANAEESGYNDFVLNADGSVTYTMSKAVYKETLAEWRELIDLTIQETVNESPDVFTSISYDKSVTSFDVTVDRAAYEDDLEARFIGFTLGLVGMFYQSFEGVPSEDQGVLINFIDVSNNEVFQSTKWPLEQ